MFTLYKIYQWPGILTLFTINYTVTIQNKLHCRHTQTFSKCVCSVGMAEVLLLLLGFFFS
jgi:hypothetical protein